MKTIELKKNIVTGIISFLLFVFNDGISQKLEKIEFEKPDYFKKEIELSSLVAVGDGFYTAMERWEHKLLYLTLDANGKLKVSQTIWLDTVGIKKDAELEGIAYYKGHLLITDEKNALIYDYKINGKLSEKVRRNTFDIFKADTSSFGMEGITVNACKNKCYILKERTSDSSSLIREFNISLEDDDKVKLYYVKGFEIKHKKLHDDSSKNMRYSDIYYNEKNDLLYCLKTFYHDDLQDSTTRTKKMYETKLQYKIDVFSPNSFADKTGHTIPIVPNCIYDITKSVDSYHLAYHTNLEGITIYKDYIYLISDNGHPPANKSTLFLKIALPKK